MSPDRGVGVATSRVAQLMDALGGREIVSAKPGAEPGSAARISSRAVISLHSYRLCIEGNMSHSARLVVCVDSVTPCGAGETANDG